MQVACPNCGRAIDPDGADISGDVARCPECPGTFRLSYALAGSDAGEPPEGCRLERLDDGFRLELRSSRVEKLVFIGIAVVLTAVSVAVGALALQPPHGIRDFPIFNQVGVGAVVAVLILGPWAMALRRLVGSYVVTFHGDRGELRIRRVLLVRRRTFDWSAVQRIDRAFPLTLEFPSNTTRFSGSCHIAFDDPQRTRFGFCLVESHRRFALRALQYMRAARQAAGDDVKKE